MEHQLQREREKRRRLYRRRESKCHKCQKAAAASLFIGLFFSFVSLFKPEAYSELDCSDYAFNIPDDIPESLPNMAPPLVAVMRNPRRGTAPNSFQRICFTRTSRNPVIDKTYPIAELQSATNSFSKDHLLGEGSQGSVFKAGFPDGQVSREYKMHNVESDGNSLPVNTTYENSPPSVCHATAGNSNKRVRFTRSRNPVTAKTYTLAELQSATNSFSEDHLLGEGSLGSVFKAGFPDGQILAVKNISTVALSIHEEEQFLDVISNVARLRHPNIVTLVGYCVEHGQHLLVYEYVRNWSLEDALHLNVHDRLTWIARIRIALSVARGLEYLHSNCLPPVAHCNLKAANILLDSELMPRLCDCGLAVLRSLTSNSVKLKASELAISCTGYTAPENSQPGVDQLKSDIYAFGVLLLELLTGRKPFDSSQPRQEESLVKWASSCLYNYKCLEAMVDPTTRPMISSRSLSRFADIVSLCIQTLPEFRPTMSEIVESLELLNDRSLADGVEGESF